MGLESGYKLWACILNYTIGNLKYKYSKFLLNRIQLFFLMEKMLFHLSWILKKPKQPNNKNSQPSEMSSFRCGKYI